MSQFSFNSILGQEKGKAMLLKACNAQKIAHAYLFRGPFGVGKKSMALSFAAYLNCNDRSPQGDVCGVCVSCKKIASGNHPDFVLLEPEDKLLKIDQVRELKKSLTFAPYDGGYRVVMLPDIHTSLRRKEVANSLLKTLEEPPQDTIFVLTADEGSALLDTILSRCQTIPFYSLPNETVTSVLLQDGVPRAEADTLAAVAEGSIGHARILAEKDFLALRREIVEQLTVCKIYSAPLVEKIFVFADQMAKLKTDLDGFLELLKSWLRDLMIARASGAESMLANFDLKHTYSESVQKWSLNDISDKMQLIDNAQRELKFNCNKVFVCEVLLWGLAS